MFDLVCKIKTKGKIQLTFLSFELMLVIYKTF